jgi:hypothetical protein
MLKEQLGKNAGKQAKVEKGIGKFCKDKKLNTKQKKMVLFFDCVCVFLFLIEL